MEKFTLDTYSAYTSSNNPMSHIIHYKETDLESVQFFIKMLYNRKMDRAQLHTEFTFSLNKILTKNPFATEKELLAHLSLLGFSLDPSTLWHWKQGNSLPSPEKILLLRQLTQQLSLPQTEQLAFLNLLNQINQLKEIRTNKEVSTEPTTVSPTFLVGRTKLFAQLDNAINNNLSTSIYGIKGIGKTAVAQTFFNQLPSHKQKQQLQLTPQDNPQTILLKLAERFDIVLPSIKTDLAIQFLNIKTKKYNQIILLDSINSASQIESIVTQLTHFQWILVSQQNLILLHNFAPSLSVQPLSSQDAIELFTYYSKLINTSENQPLLQKICARLYGHPQLIIATASYLSEQYEGTLLDFLNCLHQLLPQLLVTTSLFPELLPAEMRTASYTPFWELVANYQSAIIPLSTIFNDGNSLGLTNHQVQQLIINLASLSLISWQSGATSLLLSPLFTDYLKQAGYDAIK